MKDRYEIIRAIIEFIMVPIVSFAVYILKDMSSNIQDLNTKVSVIMAEKAFEKESILDLKQRVLVIEQRH